MNLKPALALAAAVAAAVIAWRQQQSEPPPEESGTWDPVPDLGRTRA